MNTEHARIELAHTAESPRLVRDGALALLATAFEAVVLVVDVPVVLGRDAGARTHR